MVGELGEYYMPFLEKADYGGTFDEKGIPMLDYHGKIGRQYNPIAIAQWGLGNYNHFARTADKERRTSFCGPAIGFVIIWNRMRGGVLVWNHHFDWEYRTPLRAPWYSALAQGQGISLLVRAFRVTNNKIYLRARGAGFCQLSERYECRRSIVHRSEKNLWFEEYIVSPPTHILNGFIWAAWGVYDFFLVTKNHLLRNFLPVRTKLCAKTWRNTILDFGPFTSSRDLPADGGESVLSSPAHRAVACNAQAHRRTCICFLYADRWENYTHSRTNRTRALCYKSVFKLCYYYNRQVKILYISQYFPPEIAAPAVRVSELSSHWAAAGTT